MGGDVKLSDAKPLGDLELEDDLQINLTDKLSPPLTAMQVYFGEADAYAPGDDADGDGDTAAATPAASIPVIALHLGPQWKAVPVTGAALADTGWK